MGYSPGAHRLPWWATLADILSLGLTGLALLVAVSGGFRGRVAGFLLSVTSP